MRGTDAQERGLPEDDTTILEAMLAEPILINPLVETEGRAVVPPAGSGTRDPLDALGGQHAVALQRAPASQAKDREADPHDEAEAEPALLIVQPHTQQRGHR